MLKAAVSTVIATASLIACSSNTSSGPTDEVGHPGDGPEILQDGIRPNSASRTGYCPTVDPYCRLYATDDYKTTFDEALAAAGCAPEKLLVNYTSPQPLGIPSPDPYGTKDPWRAFVSYCPNSKEVASLVANGANYGVNAELKPTLCDACLRLPPDGYAWVVWERRVSAPNCSGCIVPGWW